MSKQIEPGDGWRLLVGDIPVRALEDECYWPSDKMWHPIPKMYNLWKASMFIAVRRRIPAKPDVLEIQSEGGSISLETIPRGPVWLIQRWEDCRDEVRLDTTEQIRQVIAWLQQVADWREEQEKGEK